MQFELPQLDGRWANLISNESLAQFATGRENESARGQLDELTMDSLFESVDDPELANCCLAGLWLLHNYLHESHEISQTVKTPEGSWWHAIMHRLEGDFWNSKYWYRQVGQHPAFEDISPNWNPESFVDQCEQAGSRLQTGTDLHRQACCEWIALFNYCREHAGS